jgi:predicted PurR-regulated permease PerM
VLVWAAVLAILFYPLYRRLLRATRRPALAAAAAIAIVLVTVIVPLGLVGAAVAGELADAAGKVQAVVRPYLDESSRGGKLVAMQQWLQQRFHVELTLSPERVSELLAAASKTLLRGTMSVVGGVLGGVVKLFFVLFALYYFFRDGDRLIAALPGILPLPRAEADAVIVRTTEIIHASVNGSIVIAIVQGGLGGIVFALLGLPSPLVWGVLMILLALVPMAGTALVWGSSPPARG